MSVEEVLVQAMMGRDRPSALDTDAYKFSMAQAGFPLRPETFYLSFRRGEGPYYNPFDLKKIVELLRPELPNLKERGFLQTWGYGMTPAMEEALKAPLDVWAVPQYAWFAPGEPILTVRSASFLASWLEPLLLMLNFPLQIATAFRMGRKSFDCTCASEAAIVSYACAASQRPRTSEAPTLGTWENDYRRHVKENARVVVHELSGDAERAFEVGFRAATCVEQHCAALEELKGFGIERTSMLRHAYKLNFIPVGTTGHEHQQRYGNDVDAYRAIRDARPEMPSYLFDTYNPVDIGIPAIQQVVREQPDRRCSFRFDSGNQNVQFERLWEFAKHECPHAMFIFEDGYNADKTELNELMLEDHGFPRAQALYGYGGYFISQPADTKYTRDTVSAAYKLCETSGQPTMKFSGTPGKESIPGRPCVFVRLSVEPGEGLQAYDRLIGQQGEKPPSGFVELHDASPVTHKERAGTVHPSNATMKLTQEARDQRDAMIDATDAN